MAEWGEEWARANAWLDPCGNDGYVWVKTFENIKLE